MRSVIWVSTVICVTLVVFISIIAAALVLYLRALDDKFESDEDTNAHNEHNEDNLTELGIEMLTTISGLRPQPKHSSKLDKMKETDWVELAVKHVAPMLAELPAINDMSFAAIQPPERFNFTQMADHLGYQCTEYEVQTKDGYLLTLFHVGSANDLPVLLVHGFLDSSDTFILRGIGSLVAALTADGRDVWVANLRGNKYARRHHTLNPDVDKAFWDFSFHEHGRYDLPAIIDFVLNQTDSTRLQAISHSQGSAVFYVMSSLLPEYNHKIELLLSMAPLCHLDNLKSPLSDIIMAESLLSIILRSIGNEEILGSYSQVLPILEKMCSFGLIGSEICLEGGFFYLFGRDTEELKADFLPVLSVHFPAGTSLKNMNHMSQLFLKKSFSEYDFGFIRNMFQYVSLRPPRYDLSKVAMKTALFVARYDKISTWKDTELLRRELPNVVEHRVVRHNKFTHIDFVWGENVKTYLYPQIIEVLRKYK